MDGSNYAFEEGKITWTGSKNPFVCQADKQLRFKSIDVTIASEPEVGIARVASTRKQAADVFDLTGRRAKPSQRGVYIVNGKKIALR